MRTTTLIAVTSIILGAVTGVCYPRYGCFPDEPPWCGTLQRLLCVAPQSPEEINVRFFLWSRDNPEYYQVISARDLPGLRASSFRTNRGTILIVHGLSDRAEDNWVSDMCRELIMQNDVNCVGVDWRDGAGNVLQYAQAANNVRVVGAVLAEFITTLKVELNYSPSNIHMVGHSLGAHVGGDAGRRAPGVGRMSGLDPAASLFDNTDEIVRLDATDAEFVDVIHTDCEPIIGLGIAQPCGHFDFYPNGGQNMPGCPPKALAILKPGDEDLQTKIGCDHLRSYYYYIHSIRNPDGFLSYPCNSYADFSSGCCFPCPPQGCPTMGYHAGDSYTPGQRGTFYLNTGADLKKLSKWRYKVLTILNGNSGILDKIKLSFFGAGGSMTEQELKSGGQTFIDSPVRLHPLERVTFYWTPILNINPLQRQLGVTRVEVQSGEDGTMSFCGDGAVLNNVLQVLTPCAGPGGP